MASHEVSAPASTPADIIGRILGRDRKMIDLATRLGAISDGTHLHDLTMRQLLVLSLLSGHARPVGEIAQAIDITVSSASTLVDRIARLRLVARERSLDRPPGRPLSPDRRRPRGAPRLPRHGTREARAPARGHVPGRAVDHRGVLRPAHRRCGDRAWAQRTRQVRRNRHRSRSLAVRRRTAGPTPTRRSTRPPGIALPSPTSESPWPDTCSASDGRRSSITDSCSASGCCCFLVPAPPPRRCPGRPRPASRSRARKPRPAIDKLQERFPAADATGASARIVFAAPDWRRPPGRSVQRSRRRSRPRAGQDERQGRPGD